MSKIEMGKNYKTKKDEYPARIIATDACGEFPVVALIKHNSLYEVVKRFTKEGVCSDYYHCNLVEDNDIVREVWVNIYDWEDLPVMVYATRELADIKASPDRVACVPLTIKAERGQGL